MPQKFHNITKGEMEAFLLPQGFQPISVPPAVELVYGKIVKHNDFTMSLRVYTGINPNGVSRGAGQDAIRVQLWYRYEGEPTLVGRIINVRRIETWQKNLAAAIAKWTDEFKTCPACGSPMVVRNGRKGEFWGCVTWHKTKCSGKPGHVQPAPVGPAVPVEPVADEGEVEYVIKGTAPATPAPQQSQWERLGMGSSKPLANPVKQVEMTDRMRAALARLGVQSQTPAPAPQPKHAPLPKHPPASVARPTPAPVPPVVSRPAPPPSTKRVEPPKSVPFGSRPRQGDPMSKFRIPAEKISGPQKKSEELFLTGTKNLMLVSRAGGGKTTLLKHLASYRREGERAAYLAFNSKNAAEGRKKLPREVPSMTTHSFLKRALKDAQVPLPEEVTENKNWIVMEEVYPSMNNKDRKRIRKAAFKLIGLAKNFACLPGDTAAIKAVMDQYTFEVASEQEAQTVIEVVNDVLKLSVPGAKFGVMYDFDDMIWWPVVLDLTLPKHAFVLLDEVQDFNACQLWMVKKLMERGCRAVAVGDPFQAVYRFRGADSDAFDKLRAIMTADSRGMEEVLLPTNYRCGKAIIRYVVENTVVKDIEAAPDAIEGKVVEDMTYDDIIDMLAEEFGQPMAA